MKDRYSYIALFCVFAGFVFIYVGAGSSDAETLSNLEASCIALFGIVVALIGAALLKINEEY